LNNSSRKRCRHERKRFPQKKTSGRKKEISLVRSSAAEYLTFVAAGGSSETSVEMRYEAENIWLTQKMMAILYDVTVSAINQHLKRVFGDNELEETAVIKQYLITAADGKNYQVKHYNLHAIIAVGFKIENERAVQFRKWANQIIKDYTFQGWTMDVERLKHGGILTDEFFEQQLEKIREIRLSECKFYQKITDIYATALDYDPTTTATKRFFAAVQNKLHYAIHGQMAAEVIVDRADHRKEQMGLRQLGWCAERKNPQIRRNHCQELPLRVRTRTDAAHCLRHLDMAEMQAMRRIPMTMEDWEKRWGGFLKLWDREILQDAGKVSAELARSHAESEFMKYRIVQDRLFESDFDRMIEQTLEGKKEK
jgi:hypothetical protein